MLRAHGMGMDCRAPWQREFWMTDVRQVLLWGGEVEVHGATAPDAPIHVHA